MLVLGAGVIAGTIWGLFVGKKWSGSPLPARYLWLAVAAIALAGLVDVR